MYVTGSLIPSNAVEPLRHALSRDCSRTYTENHTENHRPKPKEECDATDNISTPHQNSAPAAVYSMPVFV